MQWMYSDRSQDVGAASDGKRYGDDGRTVFGIEADAGRTPIAGDMGRAATAPGALSATGGRTTLPGLLPPTGPRTFAVISDGVIMKLVVPH